MTVLTMSAAATPPERRRHLRDEGVRFRTIFESAPMGIVQCASDGRMLETNPAAERMLGYSREELRGKFFRDFIHPEDRRDEDALFSEMSQGQREAYELELRYLRKDDGYGWIHLKVALVRGATNELDFSIAMAEDITERKRSEQRLREAQKMEVVGRLVGGVAHDFNNLLTGIMLYTDLLVAGLGGNSRLLHHAEEIRMAGEQGAALIQQLLAISRQQVVEPRVLSINEIIQSTRNLLCRLVGDAIELDFRLREDLASVRMDPAQVQQVLFNLVLNARDAIEANGIITVETSNYKFLPCEPALSGAVVPGVMLSVTDNGCGMNPETRSRLFEPFFTTKAPGRGNGLGLATVYSIVKNSGGLIQVDSETGRGTRFHVMLPGVPEPFPQAAVQNRFAHHLASATILIVEDNPSVRRAARRILGECGYRVLEAGNGAEAMTLVERDGPIDLLLVDIMMPGMTGRELAEQLLARDPALRVLYMSGYESREGSGDRDTTVFFRKPFTGAALLERVRQVLQTNSPQTSQRTEQNGELA